MPYILCKAFLDSASVKTFDTRFYQDAISRLNRYQGMEMFVFKNERQHLTITDTEIDESNLYHILNLDIANNVLYNILKLINLSYGKRNKKTISAFDSTGNLIQSEVDSKVRYV